MENHTGRLNMFLIILVAGGMLYFTITMMEEYESRDIETTKQNAKVITILAKEEAEAKAEKRRKAEQQDDAGEIILPIITIGTSFGSIAAQNMGYNLIGESLLLACVISAILTLLWCLRDKIFYCWKNTSINPADFGPGIV